MKGRQPTADPWNKPNVMFQGSPNSAMPAGVTKNIIDKTLALGRTVKANRIEKIAMPAMYSNPQLRSEVATAFWWWSAPFGRYEA